MTSSSASSAGASEPLTQPTCEQATRRVRGPTALATSLERHFADVHAAQLARGRQRAEQPGVLLVAGEDLIAASELQAADHLRHALGGAGGERDVGLLGAERERVCGPQLAR